jgi:predicted phage tail protein
MAVYSTRFILWSGSSGETSYVVPSGYRAVIADVEAVNQTGKSGFVYVDLQGVTVIGVDFTGTGTATESWSGRVVAYAGETISIAESIGASMCVGGYLFEDPEG